MISKQDIHRLAQAGVAAIDVAGAGGTSWTQVEMHRSQDENQVNLAAAFVDWGIPTAEAIQNVTQTAPNMMIFASGGIRNGVEIAKCIALGATLGGMAAPFLKVANDSTEKVIQRIEGTFREMQVCMFAVGAARLTQLRDKLVMHPPQA